VGGGRAGGGVALALAGLPAPRHAYELVAPELDDDDDGELADGGSHGGRGRWPNHREQGSHRLLGWGARRCLVGPRPRERQPRALYGRGRIHHSSRRIRGARPTARQLRGEQPGGGGGELQGEPGRASVARWLYPPLG
jgi:hypothetical protein